MTSDEIKVLKDEIHLAMVALDKLKEIDACLVDLLCDAKGGIVISLARTARNEAGNAGDTLKKAVAKGEEILRQAESRSDFDERELP